MASSYTKKRVFTHRLRIITRNKRLLIQSSIMRSDFPHEFLMGRMHISNQRTIDTSIKIDFKNNIEKLLKGSEPYKESPKRAFVWVFSNAGEAKLINGDTVSYGIFVKVREKGIETFYDPESRKLKIGYRDKLIKQTSSIFIIYPKNQLIVFEEKQGIKINPFKHAFEQAYNKFYKGVTNLEIDLIKEDVELLKILNHKKIINIRFNLVPSNPQMRPDWEVLDKSVKKTRAKNITLELENKEDGLKFGADGIGGQAVALSGAGYGDYEATVKDRQGERLIKSTDKILRRKVNLPSGLDVSDDIVKQITKIFKKYLDREKE